MLRAALVDLLEQFPEPRERPRLQRVSLPNHVFPELLALRKDFLRRCHVHHKTHLIDPNGYAECLLSLFAPPVH